MRRTTVVCCLFLLSAALPTGANICAHDNVPAATLLFPFVAVDYENYPDGETTIINITNMSWQTQIVHVTTWTDFGQPMLNFNIILTGYDMVRLNMNEILFNGQLPVTVWEGHTGDEGTQDRGPMSSANSLYGYSPPFMEPPEPTMALGDRCDAANPFYPGQYVTPIPPNFLALFQSYLQSSQTNVRSHSDDCEPPYDNPYVPDPVPWFESRDHVTPTWFYMTADVVSDCQNLWPNELGYFVDQARTNNVLVGDVTWISGASVMAAPAVHVEADVDLGEVATSHGASGLPVSFYHRYAAYNDGVSDYREPLPTAWSMRYEGVGTDFISTSILSWKGSTNAPVPLDLEPIGSNPHSPDELVATNCLAYTYYAWDEDENVVAVVDPQVEINQLPLLTQRIHAEELSLPGTDGWLLFLWPPSNWTAVGVGAPDIWQTWMGSVIDLAGTGKAFLPAVPTANHGCFSDQGSPFFGIDYDYVDSNGYRTSPGARKPVGRNLTVDK